MKQEAIEIVLWLINNWFMIFLLGLKYLKDIATGLFGIYNMIKTHENRITALERRALNRS